jgi:hypothetical protein
LGVRADGAGGLVRRRRPAFAVMAAAAVAAFCLAGCGRSSDQTNVMDGESRGQATPRTAETLTTAVVAPVESPGVDAQLIVGALPEGWSYSYEDHPKSANGNPVVIKTYAGAPVDVKVPGGGQAYQTISVTAVWQPGYQASGANLRSLITSQAWQAIGYLDAKDANVGSRTALLLTRKSVSGEGYTVMFAVGDWWVQLNGSEVDADTLFAFAKAVEVR